MSFYKSIGSPFVELKIKDFEPPFPGGLPECYTHYGENCHLKYYGKDFYFRVRIPELDDRIDPGAIDTRANKTGVLYMYFITKMPFEGAGKPNYYCNRCVFLNPRIEKSGIRCLLRRGNSQYRCNRCVFMHDAYFEPLDLSKDTQ